jgi:LuxR family maltose regulon positive regulatory protein
MRARSQVIELRQSDLRFSAEEAGDFLREGMHVALKQEDIVALEQRTEGWARRRFPSDRSPAL